MEVVSIIDFLGEQFGILCVVWSFIIKTLFLLLVWQSVSITWSEKWGTGGGDILVTGYK